MQRWTAKVNLQSYPWAAENPIWNELDQSLWWVDMGADDNHVGNINRLCVRSKVHTSIHMDSSYFTHITPLILTDDPYSHIIGTDAGIWLCRKNHDNAPHKFNLNFYQRLIEHPESSVKTRFNDGKVDPYNAIILGTMAYDAETPCAALYRLSSNASSQFKLQTLLTDVTISNGLAWSLDNRYMYYIDTPTKKITRYDYCPYDEEVLQSAKTAFDFKDSVAVPDGMTIDEEGMLWVAMYNGDKNCIDGQILRIDPEKGEIIGEVICPGARQITCPVFGGQYMDILYATCIRAGDDGKNAGAIFSCNVGVKGTFSRKYKLLSKPTQKNEEN